MVTRTMHKHLQVLKVLATLLSVDDFYCNYMLVITRPRNWQISDNYSKKTRLWVDGDRQLWAVPSAGSVADKRLHLVRSLFDKGFKRSAMAGSEISFQSCVVAFYYFLL